MGDLVHGVRPSAVATVVDRATRYAMVVALPDGYKADAVASALIEHMGRLPEQQRSLTWDRGQEMADHARIAAALDLPIYFCDPHHPWHPWHPWHLAPQRRPAHVQPRRALCNRRQDHSAPAPGT